ncbi:hypothetical protein [Bacteroides ndongoniae]|nr:hypothetical protein [Bacteroides ndongoniae]
MRNNKKLVTNLSIEECIKISGGEIILVGWKEVDGVWIAVYRNV